MRLPPLSQPAVEILVSLSSAIEQREQAAVHERGVVRDAHEHVGRLFEVLAHEVGGGGRGGRVDVRRLWVRGD